jgi:hypothetical protein
MTIADSFEVIAHMLKIGQPYGWYVAVVTAPLLGLPWLAWALWRYR